MFKYIGKLFLIKPHTLEASELSFYKELSFENFIFFKIHFQEDFNEYIFLLKMKLSNLGWLAVDQEGGQVLRIPGSWESPLEIVSKAEKTGIDIFEKWARGLALSLKKHSLNLNLAPVVDLADSETKEFLKGRTFGKDPQKVIFYANKFIEIHRKLGIWCTLKHFPGLSKVQIDPHKDLPIKEEINPEDLLPYKVLSQKVGFVMTTHLQISKLGSLPVTFSQKALELLRKECNFEGAIMTDDLSMGALKSYSLPERILNSIASGHNLLIYCGELRELEDSLFEIKSEIEKSVVLKERIKLSLRILENLKN